MSDSRKVQEFPGEDPTKKEMQDWLDWLNAEIKGSDIDHLIAGRVPTSLISISRASLTSRRSGRTTSNRDFRWRRSRTLCSRPSGCRSPFQTVSTTSSRNTRPAFRTSRPPMAGFLRLRPRKQKLVQEHQAARSPSTCQQSATLLFQLFQNVVHRVTRASGAHKNASLMMMSIPQLVLPSCCSLTLTCW